MYGELHHKESWAPKNWCFWAVLLEKTLESSLDCKEIQPVHPKGNQSWILKLQYFGHLMWRSDSLEKTLMLGKNPLQCSCLENPRDGGPWWAAVHGIAQSQTQRKWLSSSSSSWERLKARGEGDDRGWGGWIASPTRWTWVWASSGSWWWTGKPGVLQSMGWQKVRHDWAAELNW